MEGLLATAGLIALGALTPGPNNLIVLRASAIGGWRTAIPAMTGIIAGGLALVTAVVAGIRFLLAADESLMTLMSIGACACLTGMGLRLLIGARSSRAAGENHGETRTRAGFAGLFAFQFLNPKGWVLVIAAVTSLGATTSRAIVFAQLTALFVVIPALSLAVWALAGSLVTERMHRPRFRLWLDRVTGVLLVLFALLLIMGTGHVA